MLKQLDPSDIVKILVKNFRVLNDWEIEYDDNSNYKGQCCCNLETKCATIYGWGSEKRPDDYLIHEVLHVAFRSAVAMGKEGEELFIQDVCHLVKALCSCFP
jgi:hypothetical protein